jgi:Spy/CpxP family protein refolding chaperone
MSAEGTRDMKKMLARLEAHGPFDHTEAGGWLPDTDITGTQRTKLRADLTLAEARIRVLESERAYLTTLAQRHLKFLSLTSTQTITHFRNALNSFEHELQSDMAQVQLMIHDDADARVTPSMPI